MKRYARSVSITVTAECCAVILLLLLLFAVAPVASVKTNRGRGLSTKQPITTWLPPLAYVLTN